MKTVKLLSVAKIAALVFLGSIGAQAQNIFPPTGNTGIGITTPTNLLEIQGNGGDAYAWVKRVGLSTSPYGYAGVKIGRGSAVLSVGEYPAYGSGSLQISNGTGDINIGVGGSVSFGGLIGPGYGAGKFNFGGLLWARQQVISEYNAPGSSAYFLPDVFKFGVNGKSTFNDLVVIGANCVPVDASVKLAVKGKIIANEISVKLDGGNCWADYVFDNSYKLSSLNEVEKYINENKHLPEVPSAQEVADKGLEVADMMRLQMQKIEELTLYMIELKKQNDKLANEVEQLKSK